MMCCLVIQQHSLKEKRNTLCISKEISWSTMIKSGASLRASGQLGLSVLETAERVCWAILTTGWANSAGDVELQVVSLPGFSWEKCIQKFLYQCSLGKSFSVLFWTLLWESCIRLNMLWPKRLIGFKLTPLSPLIKLWHDVVFPDWDDTVAPLCVAGRRRQW